MQTVFAISAPVVLLFGVSGCRMADPKASPAIRAQPKIPSRAEDVNPLNDGDHAPHASLLRPDGHEVDTADLYRQAASVLIFYRGRWCPHCNTHLGQIGSAERDLVAMGYQILAISPDRPEAMRATIDKSGYAYQLLSDSDMTLTKAFGLAFHVDEPTIERYHGFGIDLDKASGRSHHLLPVPAVYIVDTKGVIRFAHWNPDYKTRLQPQELLEAARRVRDR